MKTIIILLLLVQLFICPLTEVWADDSIEEVEENTSIQVTAPVTDTVKQNARIGLLYDRTTHEVLYEKNGYKEVPMASTTKIMTAIVILEKEDLSQIVEVSKQAAATGGSRLELKTGDKVSVHDLLYGLLLRSGNDAAVALAIHCSGSVEAFAECMNQKAKELGLQHTHFITPYGLDAQEHYTTAYELAKMADYAMEIPEFQKIVGTKSITITINGQPRTLNNTNELLGNLQGVIGIKTGFTNGAGRCLVTCCKRGEQEVIAVVLGADTKKIRTQDSVQLLEYAFQNFTTQEVTSYIQEEFDKWQQVNVKRIAIERGTKKNPTVRLGPLEKTTTSVRKDGTDTLEINITHLQQIDAPVAEGEKLGTLQVKKNGEIWLTVDILNQTAIPKKEIQDYWKDCMEIFQHFETVWNN